jgi:lipoprotein-anchoring transpeptidase ErfK/SrfK
MERQNTMIAAILGVVALLIFVTGTAFPKKADAALMAAKNSRPTHIDSSIVSINSVSSVSSDVSSGVPSNFSSSAVSSEMLSVSETSSAPEIIQVTGMTLSKTTESLTVGQNDMPIVTMMPKNATDKSEIWTSSNTKVATVSQSGNIKAISVGSCVVTVTSKSNKSVMRTVTVTVVSPVTVQAEPAAPVISTAMDSRAQSFGSYTNYLMLVDLTNQKVGIYRGSKGYWNLSQSYVCSSGTGGENATPTGTYKIQGRGTWFFSPSCNEGAEWWTQFSGDFLFHSLPMDKNHNVVDSTLGKPASHGCIRLAIANAKWIYDNVPRSTTVHIYY